MDISSVAFIMTDKCNASCKMCCYSCTPKGKQLLHVDRMKAYMDEAKSIPGIENIAFSGGEAMMHYDQLLECVSYAANLGFNATLVTNGFWAADYDRGYEKMKTLVDAGLRQVSVSLDKYHQEFVPIQTAKKALRILKKLGVLSMITIMDTKDGSSMGETMDHIRPEIYEAGLILYPLFEAGAAKKNVAQDQFLRLCKPETATCPYANDVVVLFDNSVMMCCSQYSHQIPMVHIGKFEEDSLAQSIQNFRQDDFIFILLSQGFGWYVSQMKRMGYPVRPSYGVACELCHEIFTNQKLVEALSPLVKEEADKMRMKKLLG